MVIVTGGSSGIGKAAAVRFAQDGAALVIASRNTKEGKKALLEIGGSSIFIKTDVRDESEVKSLIAQVIKKFCRLDVVVNSAGVYSLSQPEVATTTLESFQEVMDTNFTGTFLVTKHALPHLEKTKGCVINIASALGLVPEKESAIYCSSKAAVIMFTKAVALSYADRGVRINVVCPGPIDTPMLHNGFPNKKDLENFIDTIPMKRMGNPKEVANFIALLASPEASYMTGGVYTVDGGESLH